MADGFHPAENSGETTPVFSEEGAAEAILHRMTGSGALDSISLASPRPLGGSHGAVAAEIPFDVSDLAKRTQTGNAGPPLAEGLGAIRGFVIVLAMYLVLAALGFGAFLLWHWLR